MTSQDQNDINEKWEQGASKIASELKAEMVAYHKLGLRLDAWMALGELVLHNQRTGLARAKRDYPNAVLFGDWPQR